MVILGTLNEKPISISIKHNCLTISIDEPQDADVFSYDLEGRLWTAYLDGISYRRGLDGQMISKWRTSPDGRQRRWLSKPEAESVEAQARITVKQVYEAIVNESAILNRPLPQSAAVAFERVAAYNQACSKRDADRYHEIYKPVGILPPDQYMAVVLQATEGCSFNTCTFCDFYDDRPFYIKEPDQFLEHALAVREFLGNGLSLRRTIFLADANALVVPMKKLVPLFDVVHDVYDVEKLGGIFAFLDGFSGDKKSIADYRTLKSLGLKRVYVGLESGNKDLLSFLKKPGSPKDAVRSIRRMKSAGLAVGVIILLGAGGHEYSEAHINDTRFSINNMGLDANDIVYFSELIVGESVQYAQDAFQANLKHLTHEENLTQQERIESGLNFSGRGGVPHISRYDIREFIY